MANKNLSAAKNAKNDEFYTQYADIQKEVNAYLEYDENVFRGKGTVVPAAYKEKAERLGYVGDFTRLGNSCWFANKVVYAKQTAAAESKGVSNCPLCAIGPAANCSRIYKFAEMDADHVTAWSKGGATDVSNCQMLCKTHNRAKGNR